MIALAARAVAIKYRTRSDGERWRTAWTWTIVGGSALPALLFGVAFAGILRGIPVDGSKEFSGDFLDLIHPYALLGGVCTLLLSLSQGAAFLALRTTGEVRERASRLAYLLTAATTVALSAFVLSTEWGVERGIVPDWTATATVVLAATAAHARPPAEGRVDLRGDVGDDRLLLPLVLRPALPGRARLEHAPRVEPDRLQLVVEPLHPGGDDGRGADRPAGRALLPVVGLRVFRARLGRDGLRADEEPLDGSRGHASDASRRG